MPTEKAQIKIVQFIALRRLFPSKKPCKIVYGSIREIPFSYETQTIKEENKPKKLVRKQGTDTMASDMMEWSIRDTKEQIRVGSIMMDGWELKKKLGQGGFGDVWLAEKSIFGILDQSAIKIIRIPSDPAEIDAMRAEGFSGSSIQAEFRRNVENAVREIRTMIVLRNHPAIVLCEGFDVIQYEEDGTWEIDIRMQQLNSLTDWANSTTVHPEDVIRMGISLSDLLALCEKRSILHRDIKPTNIFVDQLTNFRLGDFGLARVISESDSTHSKGIGTKAFMAPEVFSGRKYDHRADIYSLGLVMYWLLNHLSLPFVKEGISRSEAIAQRLSGEALPVLPNVDPVLEQIIRKACEPDPEKRWRNAQEFHDALSNPQKVQQTVQILPQKPASVDQPAKLDSPNREVYDKNRIWSFDDYRGYLVNDGTISIDFYNGNETNLIIPETLGGKTVSSIGGFWGAFGYNHNQGHDITSITIPDSVAVVGSVNPFNWETLKTINVSPNHPYLETIGGVLYRKSDRQLLCCPHALGLETYSILDGTRKISPGAFSECKLLRTVTMPNTIDEIGDSAFLKCTSLTSINISRNVNHIGEFAFSGCASLASVELNKCIEKICDYTFSGSSLERITIPNSVKAIGKCSFFKCYSLTEIIIPESVKNIGNDAFYGCRNLTVKVARGSYAEQYCKKCSLRFAYI